jgi:GT2 family glycosyltransferase
MRARRRGWNIMFVPEAKVVHHKGVSSTHRLTVEYYKHLGMMRFYRKLLGQTRPRWFLTLLVPNTIGGRDLDTIRRNSCHPPAFPRN